MTQKKLIVRAPLSGKTFEFPIPEDTEFKEAYGVECYNPITGEVSVDVSAFVTDPAPCEPVEEFGSPYDEEPLPQRYCCFVGSLKDAEEINLSGVYIYQDTGVLAALVDQLIALRPGNAPRVTGVVASGPQPFEFDKIEIFTE